MKQRLLCLALGAALAGGPVLTRAEEPRNLDRVKQELRAYHETEYARELAAVAQRAAAWLEERVHDRKPGERLTAVFDLDETLLSNWPYIDRMDFPAVAAIKTWMPQAKCPAIAPVRDLYRLAIRQGVDVVFLTGRSHDLRAATAKNLREIGCGQYVALICRPPGNTETAQDYKTAARRRLSEEGRTIVLNIGDQESDLAGGYSERTFKLPNPFYFIP
jgi:predicted secreted acid phosphatase